MNTTTSTVIPAVMDLAEEPPQEHEPAFAIQFDRAASYDAVRWSKCRVCAESNPESGMQGRLMVRRADLARLTERLREIVTAWEAAIHLDLP
jgi:hypothetical protein